MSGRGSRKFVTWHYALCWINFSVSDDTWEFILCHFRPMGVNRSRINWLSLFVVLRYKVILFVSIYHFFSNKRFLNIEIHLWESQRWSIIGGSRLPTKQLNSLIESLVSLYISCVNVLYQDFVFNPIVFLILISIYTFSLILVWVL